MAPRYPLLPLLEVRRLAQEQAEVVLAQTVLSCERAKQSHSEALERLGAARERIATAARDMREGAERGPRTALELQRAEAHRQALVVRVERLVVELDAAQAALSERQVALGEAKRSLVSAKQELAVVERHRSAYDEAQMTQQEKREDEEAAEMWLVSHVVSRVGSQ